MKKLLLLFFCLSMALLLLPVGMASWSGVLLIGGEVLVVEPEAEPEPEPEPEPELKPELELKPESKTETEPNPVPDLEVEQEVEPKPELVPEPKPVPDVDPEVEPELEEDEPDYEGEQENGESLKLDIDNSKPNNNTE